MENLFFLGKDRMFTKQAPRIIPWSGGSLYTRIVKYPIHNPTLWLWLESKRQVGSRLDLPHASSIDTYEWYSHKSHVHTWERLYRHTYIIISKSISISISISVSISISLYIYIRIIYVYYLLSIIHYPLSIIHYRLSIIYYLLYIIDYLVSTIYIYI